MTGTKHLLKEDDMLIQTEDVVRFVGRGDGPLKK